MQAMNNWAARNMRWDATWVRQTVEFLIAQLS
jgi:hypothetical protein